MPIRIGTAGWSIPSRYSGLFSGEGSHLARYAQVFSCVEINSSFYRSHRPATYARWAAATPKNFRFSVKAPKAITHQSGLAPTPMQFQTFLEEVQRLGPKLGLILFQFPPRQSFQVSRVRDFFALFRDLFPQGDAVVEPRHATWFLPEADRLFEQFEIVRVVADPPPAPAATHPSGDSRLVYYRLHGSPRIYYSSYSGEYLERLAAVISAHPTTADVWCIFDNTALGAAIDNALALVRKLNLSSSPV